VVGAGPDDSPPWLATAYVPGPSLAELVRGSGPLPEAAVWRLADGYPATVTLAGLKPYGTGLEAYSTIVVQAPAANTTETYTTGTVP